MRNGLVCGVVLVALSSQAKELPVVIDCYLPESNVSCRLVQAQLTSGAVRAVQDEQTSERRLELRTRRVQAPNQAFNVYVIKVFTREHGAEPAVLLAEKIPDGITYDIAVQRVTNKALLALAACGELELVTETGGQVKVSSQIASLETPGAAEGASAADPGENSPWALNASLFASYSTNPGASTSAFGYASLSLVRSSDDWLFSLHPVFTDQYDKVDYDGVTDELNNYEVTFTTLLARSFKTHWSAAVIPVVRHSPNVKNFDLQASGLVGAEYNLVPIKTGTNNGNVIVAYMVGPEFAKYHQVTLGNELRSFTGVHSMLATVEWHFLSADPSLSVVARQDLGRPMFVSVSVNASVELRLGSRVSVGPYVGYLYQTAARNQPLASADGTLEALQGARTFSSQTISFGLSFSVNLGNANRLNQDNRWKNVR
jgi:hypothetical protein